MADVEIKQASIEDAESILHLQMRAYLSEAEIYNDYSIPPLIQTLMEIKREFVQQVFLKAIREDGEIIGSVRGYLEKGTVYVGRLIVQPEFQNKGVGTKLNKMKFKSNAGSSQHAVFMIIVTNIG